MLSRIAAFLCCIVAVYVEAKVLTVAQDGTGDFGTVRGAFAVADAGDTIEVGPGVYAEALTLEKSITLLGAGADQTTLRSPVGVIAIDAEDVLVEGFHLDRGSDLILSATISFLSGSATLKHNVISGGHFSISASDSIQIVANYNDIRGNVGIQVVGNSTTVDARFNWWGTGIEEEIVQKIEIEGNGQVDFSSWLFSADTIQARETIISQESFGAIKRRRTEATQR